ncbi:MAG TPA: type II toxin-antitoxin system RelE/ParE family toxin [Parvibaculum sp.]|jgi:phage-related protein
MLWTIKFAGKRVEKEFAKLKPSLQGALVELLDTVQQFGPQRLEADERKHIRGKIWEFRVSGPDGIARALHASLSGEMLLVLHIFEKKTQKTPDDAIRLAEKRLKEYE